MWRVVLPVVILASGCNALLGIHEIDPDAGGNGGGDVGGAPGTRDAAIVCNGVTNPFPTSGLGSDVAEVQVETPLALTIFAATTSDQLFEVEVEAESGGGSTATPDWPTDLTPKIGITLGAAVDVAVVLFAPATAGSNAVYLATSGTLDLIQAGSAVGDMFAGDIANVQLLHVDQLSDGDVMPDPDGCQTTITSFSFATTVIPAP